YGYGFGYPVVGYGYGGFAAAAFPYGYGTYPFAFTPLNQPDVQTGLAYNALATGRLAPYGYGVAPYGYGFGPFGYAGAAFYNPYFASGLTPLAVQSALEELVLSRAAGPTRFRLVVPTTPRGTSPADPGSAAPDD